MVAMAEGLVWRARHTAVGFDDWAFAGGLLVGEVVRYADVGPGGPCDVRGHYFAGFFARVELDGRHETVADAQAAVERAFEAARA